MMRDAAGPSTTAVSSDAPVAQFDGRVKRVWRSPFYLLALSFVALVMLLLPVIYLAMVAGVGYLVCWHATASHAIFQTPGVIYLKVLVYVVPLVAGPILLLFMIKPIFARCVRRESRVSLVRDNEPRLFDFVDAVCEAVGAVKPKRIDIACNVNASASFRRGLLSLVGSDLVLTIGMPLVAGLTVKQFAGVLAHEFGHFTQALAMRLTFIIDRINMWFARVVYERDSWDEKLVDWQRNSEGWVGIIASVSRLVVWMSRLTLWLLMHVAHAISCAMSRQMEFDADRYQARLTGADNFEKTFDRIVALSAAHSLVMGDLADAWKDRRLGDDLPGLIAAKVDEMPRELREAVKTLADERKTAVFSTHPTDRARKKRVRKENAVGVLRATGPASALFMNFESACKGITQIFYQRALGSHFRRDQLVSTDALKKRRRYIAAAEAAAARYFRECLTLLRPLEVDPYSKEGERPTAERVGKLRQAREAVAKSAPVMKKIYKRLIDAEDAGMNAQTARVLASEGVKFKAGDFGIEEPTVACARKAAEAARRTKESAAEDIQKIERVFRLRLECALALLKVPEFARRLTRADALFQRSRKLLSALSVVHGVGGELTQLRNGLPELRALTVLAFQNVENELLVRRLVRGIDERNEMLLDLRRMLQEQPYPFEHADGSVTMAQYAMPEMPSRQDISALHDLVVDCLDNMNTLYVRCMGELALIAEKVEAAVGLKASGGAQPQKRDATKNLPAARRVAEGAN